MAGEGLPCGDTLRGGDMPFKRDTQQRERSTTHRPSARQGVVNGLPGTRYRNGAGAHGANDDDTPRDVDY